MNSTSLLEKTLTHAAGDAEGTYYCAVCNGKKHKTVEIYITKEMDKQMLIYSFRGTLYSS